MIYPTARKVAIAVVGGTVLLFGVVALVTPVLPGAIAIPVGLAILATEFVWARVLLRRIKQRASGFMRGAPARPERPTAPPEQSPGERHQPGP